VNPSTALRSDSRRGGLLLAFLVGSGCGGLTFTEQPPTPSSERGYTLSSTSFWLDIDHGDAEPRADGRGFVVSNDLGHHLEITEAWLSFSASSLALCSPPTAALGTANDLSDVWAVVHRYLVGPAHAGHGDDYGPASIVRPLIEDLTRTGSVGLGDVSFDSMPFCRAHYVAGTAPDNAEGVAAIDSMRGRTLLVRGWVQRSGNDERVGFEIATDLNHGILIELKELMGEAADRDAVRLTVTRHLGAMFDGVDVLEDDDPGRGVLWNLIGGATLSVDAIEPPRP